MDRRRHVIDCVRPRGLRGIEIGPLYCPIIRREDGNVIYADHLSQNDLRQKYLNHDIPGGLESIVEIDLVLNGTSIREAIGPLGPVDYIVTAHVFEHIPNGIGWLCECADALNEGGKLCLLLPDKRFSFDYYRQTTCVGDLIAAYLSVLPLSAIYEYCARAHVINAFAVWRGEPVAPAADPASRAREALRVTREMVATGAYVDAHCTVFTPKSFVDVIAEIAGLGLIPFAFDTVAPTERGDVEFMVALIKRTDLTPEERVKTAPRLDPRHHHDLPRPPWMNRLKHLGRGLRKSWLLNTAR